MHPDPFKPAAALTLLLALGSSGPSFGAAVRLLPSSPTVASGKPCELKALRGDARVPHWQWQVMEPGGGTLTTDPSGRVFYHAPRVAVSTTFHVRVVDLNLYDAAVAPIQVTPPGSVAADPDLQAVAMELDDATEVPALTDFVSTQGPAFAHEGTGFSAIRALCFVEDDPKMGALNHHWLAGGSFGITVIGQGQAHRLPWLPTDITAMAARPPGSSAANPHHLVFAHNLHPGRPTGREMAAVWTLDAKGKAKLLAGQHEALSPNPLFRDGSPAGATFGEIRGLAMCEDGTVLVADKGNRVIRRITPLGWVSTFAGSAPDPLWRGAAPHPTEVRDGEGLGATFGFLHGLALDPVTKDIYVSDFHSIRRITPRGEVTTVLGVWDRSGFEPFPPGEPVPLGVPCLNEPTDLQVLGDHLLIADTENQALRTFNLKTRVLETWLGEPTQQETRLGPLRRFAPELPAQACAAVQWPEHLAVNGQGVCLVGLPFSLGRLDLPAELRPWVPPAGREDAPDEAMPERPAQEPASATATATAQAPTPSASPEPLVNREGRRLYPCPIAGCPSILGSSSALAKHLNSIHSDERSFACPVPGCGKLFKLKGVLADHVKRVHPAEAWAAVAVRGLKRAATVSPQSSGEATPTTEEPAAKRKALLGGRQIP